MIKMKQEVEQFLNQFGIKFDVWGEFSTWTEKRTKRP